MSLHIHTASGLLKISGDKVTEQTIVQALGYKPSDFSGGYYDLTDAPNIVEDSSGILQYADTAGNVIAEINNLGLNVTGLYLNGVDITTLIPEATDLSKYYTKEEVDAAIANISVDLSNYYNKTETDEKIAAAVTGGTVDLSNYATITSLNEVKATADDATADLLLLDAETEAHITDSTIHVTANEKNSWNNKSTFSGSYNDLQDKPNITMDDEDNTFYLCDANGNLISKFDSEGLYVVDVILDGESLKNKINLMQIPTYNETNNGQVLGVVNGALSWINIT